MVKILYVCGAGVGSGGRSLDQECVEYLEKAGHDVTRVDRGLLRSKPLEPSEQDVTVLLLSGGDAQNHRERAYGETTSPTVVVDNTQYDRVSLSLRDGDRRITGSELVLLLLYSLEPLLEYWKENKKSYFFFFLTMRSIFFSSTTIFSAIISMCRSIRAILRSINTKTRSEYTIAASVPMMIARITVDKSPAI